VYYSAFSPIPHAAHQLPAQSPPLLREHRLYQADWLLRFYGFDVSEITGNDSSMTGGMLDLDVDPKLAWALRNRHVFPVPINTAPRELLLRVPGIGAIGAQKIIQSRRFKKLRLADIAKCGLSLKKIEPFIEAADSNGACRLLEGDNVKQHFIKKESAQMALF